MAQGRRISGILVPIQLDTSNVQKDMEDLSKGLGTVINSIQKKFEGALNTKDLANNVVKVTRAMGDLRDSADALGRINGVNIFKSNLSGLSPALKDISAAFGGTVQQQKELYAQLVKTQAIDQQVKALETLQRMLKITAQEAVKLAQSRGVKLSSEALSQVLPAVEIAPIEPSRFKRFADSLRTQFREAAQAAGTEGNAALERSFVKEGLLKQVYADIKKVAEGTGVAKSEMAAFFESIGKGGVWDKFNPIAQLKAQIEQLPRVLTGASDTYKKYSELLYTSGFKETPGVLGRYEQGLRDTAAINAAKELAAATGMSAKELRAEAEAAGFTKEMLDKLIPSTKQLTEFSSQLGKSAADYRMLATSAGVTPSQEGYQKFLDTANIRRSISAFEQLNIGQKVTTANFEQIATAAKVSTQQVADYVQAVSRANTIEQLPRVLTGASDSYKKYSELLYTSGFKETPGTLGKYEQALRDNAAVAAAKELGSVLNLPSEQLRKMAEAAGYSKEMLDKLAPSMKSVAEASTRTLTGASDSYKKYSELLYTSGFKETPGALGRYEQGLRDTAAINAAKELAAATGMSAKELRAEAEAAGFTKEMLDKLIPSTKQLTDFSSQLGKASAEYRRLATMSGIAPSQEGYQKFLDTKNIRSAISAFEQLNVGQKVTTANFEQIASAAKVSTQQVAEYISATTKAQTAAIKPISSTTQKEGRGLMGIFTPSSISAGAQSALAATGVVTGMYGITELVKASYQATMKMDNLNLSFESIYGSAAKAGAQLDFVKKVSDDLGLSFTDTAEGAKKLFAAARGTEVEKDANQIFKAFSTMGAALKLTGDETNSVFLAVSQMISKGKVSAEELRLQLAERMPGAVTLFAKAIGVTTKELDQMLQNGQVGLDSLRKFALEVEKTYAAGAAGAAKGMQAELNRVSTAWFFLKQAFVDSKGTAEALSVVSSALKTITEYAPQIAAVGSALLKLGVAAAGVYAIARSLAALSAAFAALQTAAGAIKLRNALTAAFSPLSAGIALAAGLVAAVWSITPAHEAAAAAIQNVTFDMDKYGEAAKNAADQVGRMNRETQANAMKRQQDSLDVARARFTRFGETGAPELNVEGTGYTQRASAYAENLQAIKSLMGIPSTAQNRLLTEAQNLGAAYYEAFNAALEQNASQEQYDFLTKAYVERFQRIKLDMEKQGVPPDVIKSFTDFTNKLLESGTAAQTAKQALEDLQKGTADSALAMKEFNNAYDSILKVTKETELGKQLTYQTEAKGAAKQLVDMVPAVEAARAKIEELKGQSAENNAELKAAQEVIEKNSNAFTLLGQAAIKSKMDLTTLQEGIRLAGEAAGLTKDQIEALQKQAEKGFRIGAIQTMGELGAELDIEKLMAGATAGQKKTLSVLQGYAKDKQQALEMAKAVRKGSVEGLTIALKDPSVTQEDIATLWKKATEATASVDTASGAKKAQANWESINSTIQQATKTLETWRSKVDESKSDQFGATIVSEVEKIDKAIRSSKGNTEQLAQLRSLREEILRTGELRKQQIKEEQEREQSKEMTRYRTRVTAGYKKLEGVDNIETYAAAKGQYEDDVKFFQHALDEKRISQEDFNSYMMMLNKTLADAQLRSQTDMFSRLKVAANDYYKKYGDFTRNIGDVVTTAMDSSAKAIAAFARSGASDFASLADAFARMAEQILATATDLFAQQAVSALWKGLGDWIGGGGVGADTGAASDALARENISYGMQANGGVFGGGNLSAYSGSIVSSPTLFSAGTKVPAYATGAGLMGEAGPEGIFPLTRINGKLGVRAEMGQQQPTILNQAVSVNVNNASGSQVTTQQTKDNQGNISIDVMIEEAVGKSMRRPGSSPYKSLQSNFGARQQLASV